MRPISSPALLQILQSKHKRCLWATTTALTSGVLMALLGTPNAAIAAPSCTVVVPVPTGYTSAFNCTGTHSALSFGTDTHITAPGAGDVIRAAKSRAALSFTGTNGFLSIGNGAIVKSDEVLSPNARAIILNNAGKTKITVKDGGLINVTSTSFAANGIDLTNSPDATITVEKGGTLRTNGGFGIIGDAASSGAMILNSGTIENTHGSARSVIQLEGAKITNEKSGVIRSASNTLQTVALNDGGMLTNHGTIANTGGYTTILGDETKSTSETIINSGVISSTGSSALDLKKGDDILELQPGFSITGTAFGGDGNDTLRFGGTGTASFGLGNIGIGQQFQEFEIVEVTGGAWSFTGSTTEDFTVKDGTIKGTGTFGNLTFNGGTFAPGNSIGTTKVAGNLSFNSGSTYEAEIDNAGGADLIEVTGRTTINTGATLSIQAETLTYPDTSPTYTILTSAGGITGTFGTVTDNMPDLDFAVDYRSNDIRLTYTKTNTNIATNTSPKEILSASLGGAGIADVLFRSAVVGTRGTSGNQQRLSFKDRPDDITLSTQNANAHNWTVWTAAVAQKTDVGASGALLGWDSSVGGGLIGVDMAPDLGLPVIATAALGFTNTQTSAGTSTSNVATTHFGLAASLQTGSWTLDGGLTYGSQTYENTRRIPIGAAVTTAMGRTSGSSLGVSLNAYYDLAANSGGARSDLSFGPVAGVDWTRIKQAGYSETGAGALNLDVAGSTHTQGTAKLGMAGSLHKSVNGARVTFDGLLALERSFGDRSITSIATLPVTGQQFTTVSAPVALNRAVVGLGASIELGANTTGYVSYEGRFDSRTSDHRAALGISVSF